MPERPAKRGQSEGSCSCLRGAKHPDATPQGIEAEPIGVQARRPALARGGRQFVLEDVIGLLRSAELLAAPLEEAQVLQSNGVKQKIDNQDSHAGVDRPSGYR
jgi:hypothetical protein